MRITNICTASLLAGLLVTVAFGCTDRRSSVRGVGPQAARGSRGAQAGVNGAPTWWDDVQPIVAVKCQLCHGSPPTFGAPRSFVSYDDTQEVTASGELVHELMARRIVDPQRRMPPPTQPQLTDGEIDIITTWSQSGAAEGTQPTDAGVMPDAGNPADASTPPMDAGTGPTTHVVSFLAHEPGSTSPYSLPTGETQYTCWAFSVPPSMTGTSEHAIRFEPVIDNTRHLHHMLLFKSANGGSPDGPFACNSWPLDWNLVAGWAPGRMADNLPPVAGVEFNPGDQFVLQAHYHSVTALGDADQSGMRVLITDAPNLASAGMMWAGTVWLSPISGPSVSRVSSCVINTPFTMFSVFPHMHELGTRISLEVQRAGQTDWTTLVNVEPWSFDDQPNVQIPESEQQMSPGDQLRTTCVWNTQGRSVRFGEATTDEMCFNFLYHYPLVSDQYACVVISP